MNNRQAPPPPIRVVRGPDGKSRTEEAPQSPVTPETLAEAHRSTRARIDGTEQFHEDAFSAAPAAPEVIEVFTCPFCGISRAGEEDWHCTVPPSYICPKL
jgi:rubrerythrin